MRLSDRVRLVSELFFEFISDDRAGMCGHIITNLCLQCHCSPGGGVIAAVNVSLECKNSMHNNTALTATAAHTTLASMESKLAVNCSPRSRVKPHLQAPNANQQNLLGLGLER